MTQNTEDDIGNWCQCLTSRVVDEHLRTLEMRTSGSKFAKMNRLLQWLLGLYDPGDFQSEEGQSEQSLWVKRENLRNTFILEQTKSYLPPAWANITGESEAGEAHRLTLLAEDEETQANLEEKRLAITKTRTPPETENVAAGNVMLHTTPQNSGNDTNLISVADDTTLPQFMEPMAPMTSSTGTKFMVPEVFLEFCDQLMRENKTLHATSNTQGAASSSKVYEDRARNIHLQDTYTCQYPANSTHDDVLSPQVHFQDRPQPLLANHSRAWGGGGRILEKRSTSEQRHQWSRRLVVKQTKHPYCRRRSYGEEVECVVLRKGDHRSEKQKQPPSKTTSRNEKESRHPTSDGKKSNTGGENDRRNSGPADPIKCWGCGRIG